jgi:hypothetical protein
MKTILTSLFVSHANHESVMSDVTHIHVNAIAFPADGTWVAQGVEYDIVAHA